MKDSINDTIWNIYLESRKIQNYPKNQNQGDERELYRPYYIRTGILEILVEMSPKNF